MRSTPTAQDAAPIADAMRSYWEREMLSFSIPAHSGGRGPAPEFTGWAGMDAARFDLPMTHGVDTRNMSRQVQSSAQKLFAEAIGAQQTMFSTNGSSMNVHVAMMTVAGPGETLVMARNGHKSAFAGLVLSGARPVYVEPSFDEALELALDPRAEDLARILDAHPEARAAMVTTPSYYGTAADIRALAEVCHERGLPLVTDDAWGLDYEIVGHPDLPPGALKQGSDLAIGSAHKALTGLCQTSVLSVGSDRIDTERLGLCCELKESTSASALLLWSIDGARRQFVRDGHELLERGLQSARLLRRRLAAEVPVLEVVSSEELASRPGVSGADPTHVLIETAPVGLSATRPTTGCARSARSTSISPTTGGSCRSSPSPTARQRSTGSCALCAPGRRARRLCGPGPGLRAEVSDRERAAHGAGDASPRRLLRADAEREA